LFFFFFQAEDGIRDKLVTGVQTCALPIFGGLERLARPLVFTFPNADAGSRALVARAREFCARDLASRIFVNLNPVDYWALLSAEIGRASCRERVEIVGVAGAVKKEKI